MRLVSCWGGRPEAAQQLTALIERGFRVTPAHDEHVTHKAIGLQREMGAIVVLSVMAHNLPNMLCPMLSFRVAPAHECLSRYLLSSSCVDIVCCGNR